MTDTSIKEKQWYLDRVGKRIYRSEGSCNCSTCTSSKQNGLSIKDKDHADYLFNIGIDLGIVYWD